MKLATQAKKTESKKCLKCGTEFNRRRFGERLEDFTRWSKRKYCSKECNYVRPEAESKGAHHATARNFIESACSACGTSENLQVHHKDREWRNNNPDNLQTLCGSCHMKLHWKQGDMTPQTKNLKRGTQKAVKPQ